MMKSKRTALVAALIFMAAPSAGLAGTRLPDDQGIVSGSSMDETEGAIQLISGIDPTHILFDVTDATSLKSAGIEMTERAPAGNSRSGGADNGFEFPNFRSEGATRSVPEPTSLSLIALAGIGFVARFLRRHRLCVLKS